MTTAILLVFLGALSRLLPHPPNFVALGALALYSGARLPRRLAFVVPVAAMALADVFLDAGSGRGILSPVRLTVYATFVAIVAIGMLGRRWLASASASVAARCAAWPALAAAGSVLFFLTSNFAEWATDPTYPATGAGLALCYAAAIPFFWNTLAADLAGTAVLFGLDAASRRRQPASRRLAAALLFGGAGLLLPALLSGQTPSPAISPTPAPVSEAVVVTATLSPDDERGIGSATTVITRERIEASGATTVLEVLRSVPGLDVSRQGSDGALTSVFLRGTNSTQTLVLVDGARVNSPFFAGYDFSALTTENVERIEIVRGPFSALYGSDAIGGVIQIFTRGATGATTARATLEAGSAGQRQGAGFVTTGAGPLGISASFRDARVDGDRSNEDWRERNGSFRVESRLGEDARVAVEGSILDGETGNPGAVGNFDPTARGLFREERIALPVSFSPAEGHRANVLFASVDSKPSFRDPVNGFDSDTDARSLQGRVSDAWTSGAHSLTAFGSWDRWKVDDHSNFGTNLSGQVSTLWGAGLQDAIRLGASLTATAGLRYDRHSEFGSAWSPRATLAWLSSDSLWKARLSAGRAFRAPTVGELFYPFFGNPDLAPERSSSYEAGVERYFAGGRAEISLFWNDLTNLIAPDFTTSQNKNIGRARTRGVEAAWQLRLLASLDADVSYTYLDAQDRVAGTALLRRPRHRASVSLSWRPVPPLTVSPRAVFVGSRRDIDGLTFGPTESPSYTRVDLFARWDLGHVAPYARLENATDRRYAEVNGYPAPRRRWAGGMEVKF
jgi:vitamin B12 transporter